MKLIALDLASTTGVAIGDTGDRPYCHTERMGPPGSSHGQRFTQMLRMTKRLILQHEPDVIVVEQAIAGGVKGGQERVQLAMGYRAAVMITCFAQNLRVEEYAVSSIRKHFIGDGKMAGRKAKAAVMARCRHLGWHAENDNESDAAAAWDYARARLTGRSTLPRGLFDGTGDKHIADR